MVLWMFQICKEFLFLWKEYNVGENMKSVKITQICETFVGSDCLNGYFVSDGTVYVAH